MPNPVLTNTAITLAVDVNGAQAAATFAEDAQESAVAAAASAASVAAAAVTATNEAAAALASQNAAAASATASATSATASASSATAASASATNVSALLASFRGVFLGAFASDSAAQAFATANSITLVAGIMYENTTEDKFRIYSGSAWGDYDATAQASQSAAALSATNAAASASAAASSATAASGSASAAASSATAASGSASTATTQAGNASTSATNAASSASAAATSASSAAGAVSTVNGVLTISVAGGLTLSPAQAGNGIHVYTGTLTANTTVTLPMSSHPFIAENQTTGGFTLTVAATGGTASVTFPANSPNATMELICDGSTGILQASTAFNNPILSAPSVIGSLVGNLVATGKLSGLNNPNLLFNGSGEFGAVGWTLGSFSVFVDTSGGIGSFFSNPGTLTSYTYAVDGQQVSMGAGQNVCLSMDVSNGATGAVQLSIAAYTSTGSYISNIGTLTVPNSGLTRYSTTAVTPANTAYVVPQLVLNGVSSSAFGIVFRRVKVEQGTTPSLYSTEADIAALSNGVAPLSVASLSATGKINGVNSPNLLVNGSGEFGSTGWPTYYLTAQYDTTGAAGWYFGNTATISTVTYNESAHFSVGAGVQLTISGEANTAGVSAGNAYFRFEFFNAAGASIGYSASKVFTNGQGWTYGYVTITTPANTAAAAVQLTVDTSPSVSAYGLLFRRIKVEIGTTPSLYSQEASLASIGPGASVVTDTGAANAYVTAFTPALTAPVAGKPFWMLVAHTNTSASTLNATGTVYPLIGGAHSALQGNELIAGGWALIDWNAGQSSFVVLECTGASVQVGNATQSSHADTLGQRQAVTGSIGAIGFRNRAINGACSVAQRGSLAATAGTGGYGGPDRFLASNGGSAGGQFTQSQGTITYGGVVKSAVVQTVNTAVSSLSGSNYWGGINQPIEGLHCYDLLGQPAVISFIFSTNVSGTYTASLRDYSGSNSFVSTFTATAGVPVKVTIPVASIPTTLTTPNSAAGGMYVAVGTLNTGTYQTSTLNSWATGNLLSASGATNWGATAGNFIALTELQLETGTVATPFERRPGGLEYLLCERYYQVSYGNMAAGTPGAGNTCYTDLNLSVSMRATPTASVGTVSYANSSSYVVTPLGVGAVRLSLTASSAAYGFAYVSAGVLALSAEL